MNGKPAKPPPMTGPQHLEASVAPKISAGVVNNLMHRNSMGYSTPQQGLPSYKANWTMSNEFPFSYSRNSVLQSSRGAVTHVDRTSFRSLKHTCSDRLIYTPALNLTDGREPSPKASDTVLNGFAAF